MRRRLNPAVRRTELLEAAIHVLQSRGPAEARVEDITEAAGAAKGTFYLYFPSWNDLLAAVRQQLLTAYTAEFQERKAAAKPSEHWETIESECVRFVDYVIGLGDLHKAIFHGPIAEQPIDASLSAETLIAGMLKAGIEAGACRPVDVQTAAPLLFSIVHTTADGIVHAGDREQKIETMLGLLRAWLREPQPHAESVINIDPPVKQGE